MPTVLWQAERMVPAGERAVPCVEQGAGMRPSACRHSGSGLNLPLMKRRLPRCALRTQLARHAACRAGPARNPGLPKRRLLAGEEELSQTSMGHTPFRLRSTVQRYRMLRCCGGSVSPAPSPPQWELSVVQKRT